MNDTQEILLDALSALRNFEAADEGDRDADAAAVLAVYAATDALTALGYRKGADGQYHRR
jgi:hypothetical protein